MNMDMNFYELTQKVKQQLEALQYSDSTLHHYQVEWNRYAEFMKQHNISDISSEHIQEYFFERFNIKIDDSSQKRSGTMRTVRRSLTVLIDYLELGVIYRRQAAKEHKWPECFENVLIPFMQIITEKLSAKSVRQYRSKLESFTTFLMVKECYDFSMITPSIIAEYWDTRKHLSKKTLSYDTYVLRKFFDFLYDNNIVTVDYSVFVPKIQVNAKGNIPSYYTADELTTLLASVDRTNPMGKRDYAILLLAIRYGMRVGDIRNLKLSSFDWVKSKFTFVQSKTTMLTEFYLLPEVADALIDYFKNGRPHTTCPYVFVRHNAPYTEFGNENNLHNIISKYMRIAGFTDLNRRKHGLHALRHSIAGNMLEQGIPISTVSEVLRHSSSETTMIYTKINIMQLANCTLEVE